MVRASDVVIAARGLGKRYRISHEPGRFPTLRDAVARQAARLVGRGPAVREETLWALRDVNVEVRRGEILGVIGANGAGKSTFLKILSRITPPTEGDARLRGRVGSLLEVGTGFHPELTGRENIHLNGAILGMTKAEVTRQFDAIVDFAEVERFLDTPVKRYSSGMYLRLAFAVAAHLEPEILLVDEVLAVGDASFQKKCLGKMGELVSRERTVLFVSHNLDAVVRLCPRTVRFERGGLADDGASAEVVARYLAGAGRVSEGGTWLDLSTASRKGVGGARIRAARFAGDAAGSDRVTPGSPFVVRLLIDSDVPCEMSSVAVTIRTLGGLTLINADLAALGERVSLPQGLSEVRVRFEALHLAPGRYSMGFWIGDVHEARDWLDAALEFDVMRPGEHGSVGAGNEGLVSCPFAVSVHASGAPSPTNAT